MLISLTSLRDATDTREMMRWWLRGRASNSQLREPGFESCAAVLKPWARFFTLHCSSSLSCINEYLAIDTSSLRALMALDASQRSCLIEQVCQGSKV